MKNKKQLEGKISTINHTCSYCKAPATERYQSDIGFLYACDRHQRRAMKEVNWYRR